MSQILQLHKDDLRELIYEYSRNDFSITSNLLGELKQNQQEVKEVSISHGLKIDALIDTLKDVKEQTIKTNGRVSALEKWKYTIVGGMIVLGAMNFPNIVTLSKLFI